MNKVELSVSKYDELVENTRLLKGYEAGTIPMVTSIPITQEIHVWGGHIKTVVRDDLNLADINDNTVYTLTCSLKYAEEGLQETEERNKELKEKLESKQFPTGYFIGIVIGGMCMGAGLTMLIGG